MNTNNNGLLPGETGQNSISNNTLTWDETSVNTESMLNEALKYAEAGYTIFPAEENGKRPATTNGFKDASSDKEQIIRWWSENPNYNIGLPMASNGLVCIDVDKKPGKVNGFEKLEEYVLTNRLSGLQDTCKATTPNDGLHIIGKAPENFAPAGKLVEGVDIKYNGYIVVAPSKIEQKRYEWIAGQGIFETEPKQLPQDWVKHLSKQDTPKRVVDEDVFVGDYPTSNAEKVAESCNFIRHCVEDSQNLSEPDWKFGLVSVISFCENGGDYVHSWSKDYKGYTVKETEEKINAALEFGRPTTCKGIQAQCGSQYCEVCEYNGKITSPIVLGYDEPDYEELEADEPVLDLNFPVDVFPEKIKQLILNASYVMDAPLEYFAVAIMAIVAFLINSQAFIKVKENWLEPAVLWLILVGEPGKTKKSPVYKLIKSILDKIDKELDDKYEEDLAIYQQSKLQYEAEYKEWQKDRKNNKDDNIKPPVAPKEPARILIYTSDTTIEAISFHQSQNPHGIGIMRDEISGFLEGFNKYQKSGKGGNERQYYLSAFTGDNYIVSRKTEKVFSVRPYHNIFGSTQPSKVKDLLVNDLQVSDGFTERFLFSLTNHRKRAKMVDEDINQELMGYLEELMRGLYRYLMEQPEVCYELDKEAQARLYQFIDYLDAETLNENHNKLLQSYLVKITTCIPRIALILHCLNDYTKPYVNIKTVESAFLAAQYFINCFITITRVAVKIKNNSLEGYVIEWLKLHNKDSITPSALFLKNTNKYKNVADARKVLENIAKSGYGKVIQTQNGGTKWVK